MNVNNNATTATEAVRTPLISTSVGRNYLSGGGTIANTEQTNCTGRPSMVHFGTNSSKIIEPPPRSSSNDDVNVTVVGAPFECLHLSPRPQSKYEYQSSCRIAEHTEESIPTTTTTKTTTETIHPTTTQRNDKAMQEWSRYHLPVWMKCHRRLFWPPRHLILCCLSFGLRRYHLLSARSPLPHLG
jgi:hypothetical protein